MTAASTRRERRVRSWPLWRRAIAPPPSAHVTVPTLVIHGDADPLVPIDGGEATAAPSPELSCS